MARKFLNLAGLHVWMMAPALLLVSLSARPAVAQNQLWIEQLGSDKYDEALAAAPDGSGGLYLGGFTRGSLGGPFAGFEDAWLARYDGAGNQRWIQQLNTGGYDNEILSAVAPDGSGGAFFCGYTSGPLGGIHMGGMDAWLARYDSAGNQVWIRQLGTIGGDYLYAAAPDGSGGVYVSGGTSGNLGGPNAGTMYDAWLARFDGAGNQLWVRQLGTSGFEESAWANASAPDGSGGVYVVGQTWGSLGGPYAGDGDVWLAHYDAAGNQSWIRQFGTSNPDHVTSAATDGVGGVYVAGWDSTPIVIGPPPWNWDSDAWLTRYDSVGNQSWFLSIGGSEINEGIGATAPDGSGGVYVAGLEGPHCFGCGPDFGRVWLARIGSTGNPSWIHTFASSKGDEMLGAAAADGTGGVFVVGTTGGSIGGPNAGHYDAWLAHYDSTCPTPEPYCIASTTSIPGCQAAIAGSGTPSFANPSGFTITSGNVPGGNIGICFFGNHGQAAIPFGTLGGQICVAPPVSRCAPTTSGGTAGSCDGQFTFTLQDLINASPGIVFAGAILNAQIWSRDPGNADGYLLSDGLEFTVCP